MTNFVTALGVCTIAAGL